ncbi:hypothetical protein RO3G_04221 [Rhizopus delemar RA 99-880]|uniref:Uncharacterized protein n=1 Tax=Rhizopus delemar (strain RA 99-880 / ATCC MYA-4621 / FGSC 9543 / NRRL 43880) TaxID=246409 RepID=I1BTI6_RHIO9|nr:hypothetical protein RO3G_04221 [Rhizopus delemar RA 99-880]|eukprot:EIE79516.1 hypothetical protein RO3G_04221 [Rhizopus delemar RA 99-880]
MSAGLHCLLFVMEHGSYDSANIPNTRAKTTIILNAISDYGVVQIKIERSGAPVLLKERNIIGSTQTARNAEDRTVTDYYNFIINALGILCQQG